MNKLNLKFRIDSLQNWEAAENETPAKGNLAKGEVGIAVVETTDQIIEVIGRIGIEETPTLYSSCPVIFRSPIDFTGENSQIAKLLEEPQENSFITYEFDTEGKGQFTVKSYNNVVSDLQLPSDVISFNPLGSDIVSGFLKWEINSEYPQGRWVLDDEFVQFETPTTIYGGNAESF